MDHNETPIKRLYLLAAFLAAMLLLYLCVLFDTQVNHYDDYVAQSIHSITQPENVESSRGIITDRNGRPLVTNRSTYALTFDAGRLRKGDDENEAILRLLRLCQEQGVEWNDNLPISKSPPFSYTIQQQDDIQKRRFLKYLLSLDEVKDALGDYLLEHPWIISAEAADAIPSGEEADEKALRAAADSLTKQLTIDHLDALLLNGAGISTSRLLQIMAERMKLPDSFSLEDARLVLGVQYELSLRKLSNIDTYVLANDVDTAFISLLSDGGYAGAKISRSTVREYQTTYAAHILGTVSRIQAEDLPTLSDDYDGDDWIGRSGVEAAFESYLKGSDGRRIVSVNSDGKVTGEHYSIDPRPGSTVELTIDLDLQTVVEDALAETVSAMTADDGDDSRGGAAAVIKVGTGEVLSLASYPSYDLSTYRRTEIYNALSTNPANPFFNRATNQPYAPGSTLKPLTAVAALESGATTLKEKIKDTGRWIYPGTTNDGANCWIGYPGHGKLNVTQAITNSCNYFFAEMGYRMEMDTFQKYLSAFGLGENSGIEIGDNPGSLPQNNVGEDLAPWAAFGQANQEYTPLQLANYIATLVSGGKHCQAHLLKAVKSYDSTETLAVGDTSPVNIVDFSESTLNAVKQGMLGYTQPGGMVYQYFRNCVVSAGAKTGTAQLGGDQENNGVFVCFAPYDDPEIAVAIAIEHGGAGAALATTAVNILNAYFAEDETGAAITGENQLLP